MSTELGVEVQPYGDENRCPFPSNLPGGLPCYTPFDHCNRWLNRLVQQYSEIHPYFDRSGLTDGEPYPTNLISLLQTWLNQSDELLKIVCELNLPLCIQGEIIGFPCCHCNIVPRKYFSLCATTNQQIVGCNGTETIKIRKAGASLCADDMCLDPEKVVYDDFCFDTDDEAHAVLYEKFLSAWKVKRFSRGLHDEILQVGEIMYGAQSYISKADETQIIFNVGRDMSSDEIDLKRLYEKVFPVPRGVEFILSGPA